MAIEKKKEGFCDCCGTETIEGVYQWKGYPFSKTALREICVHCGAACKACTVQLENSEIAITGTCDGSVHSLKEMLEEGFDKEQSILSIKKVGAILGVKGKKLKGLLTA